MLEINKIAEGTKLILALEGRVDTETASIFDDEVAALPDGVTDLVLNMEDLEYV